jgi:hypothetical protein
MHTFTSHGPHSIACNNKGGDGRGNMTKKKGIKKMGPAEVKQNTRAELRSGPKTEDMTEKAETSATMTSTRREIECGTCPTKTC